MWPFEGQSSLLAYLQAAVPRAIDHVTPSFKEIADFCHDGILFGAFYNDFYTIVSQIRLFI